MGIWGYGAFENDKNLDFKYLVEDEISKGASLKDACKFVSRSDWFNGYSKDELRIAKAYIFKEKGIGLTKTGEERLKNSILNLLEYADLWDVPNLRKKALLDIAKDFNIKIKELKGEL